MNPPSLNTTPMPRVAILDDWQGEAETLVDWAPLRARAALSFFQDPAGSLDAAAARYADFDIILAMRERQPFPASLIARLPKLRMLALTGKRAGSMDMAALAARGIPVCNTAGSDTGASTAELAVGLMLAGMRQIVAGERAIRAGGFQGGVASGISLEGKTLGVIGLGRIGGRVARAALAMDMKVLAWSQNLTAEAAQAVGATRVDKQALLAAADVVSLHLVLSQRTQGILGAADLALMKPGALLVNTSRGPLVEEQALVAALRERRITAGLDVFWEEPLPADHPLRTMPNTVLTPHLGYVVQQTMPGFYHDSIENILAFLDGRPIRVINDPRT